MFTTKNVFIITVLIVFAALCLSVALMPLVKAVEGIIVDTPDVSSELSDINSQLIELNSLVSNGNLSLTHLDDIRKEISDPLKIYKVRNV